MAYKPAFSDDRFSFWLAGALFFSFIIVLALGWLVQWNSDLVGALAGALIAGAATLFGTAIAARQTRLSEIERQQNVEAEVEALRWRIRTMIITDVCVICKDFIGIKLIMDRFLPSILESEMIPIGNIFMAEFHETPLIKMIGDQITLLGSDELEKLTRFLRENSTLRFDLSKTMSNPGQNSWSNVAFARQRISDLLHQGANLIEIMQPDTQMENRRGQKERAVDLLRRVAGSHFEPQQ